MRTRPVVARDILAHHMAQMAWIEDEDLVQALFAHRPYLALGIGIRIWRSIRRVDDLDLFGNEDSVERLRELAVVVMD